MRGELQEKRNQILPATKLRKNRSHPVGGYRWNTCRWSLKLGRLGLCLKIPQTKRVLKIMILTQKLASVTEMTRNHPKSQTQDFWSSPMAPPQPGQRLCWAGQGWPLRNCRTWVKPSTVCELLASRDEETWAGSSQSTSKSTQGKTRREWKDEYRSHGTENTRWGKHHPHALSQEKWLQEDPATGEEGYLTYWEPLPTKP